MPLHIEMTLQLLLDVHVELTKDTMKSKDHVSHVILVALPVPAVQTINVYLVRPTVSHSTSTRTTRT